MEFDRNEHVRFDRIFEKQQNKVLDKNNRLDCMSKF